MAISPLKRQLGVAALLCGALALSSPTFAAQLVLDTKAVAEAKKQYDVMTKQMHTLTEQLSVLQEQRDKLETTLQSIGSVGQISIPTVNFTKISGQIMKDMNCLVPDYKSMMPNISSKDLDVGMDSICQRGSVYKQGLVASSDDLRTGTWAEKRAKVQAIQRSRQNALTGATTKGMAQADMAQERATETLRAAQEYKSAGTSAETVNERLQVLIEVNVAQLATQAQTNQLLAQLLKVSSTEVLNSSVPIENEVADDAENKE